MRFKSFIKSILIISLLIIQVNPAYSQSSTTPNNDSDIRLIDNTDQYKEIHIKIIKVNDYPYLPLKEVCLFYRIGFTFDPSSKGVTLKKNDKSVTILPDVQDYQLGKKKIKLEKAPMLVNWKMVIPPKGMAAMLEELLDYPVVWRAAKRTFKLNDTDPVTFWEDNPAPETAANKEARNTIQPGDILTVSVWQQGSFELDELTREREVEPDGSIKFPFVGRIYAAGMTSSQLETRIKTKLKGYIKNPEVTVSVNSSRKSYTVQIFGEVRNPGLYEYTDRATLMEAINRAGGFTDSAKLTEVRVTRFIHHSPYQTDTVNCKLILHEGQRQFDVPVLEKDIIFVPKKSSFWNSMGDGLSQISPILSTTAILITVIIGARSL
ncbi:polysaccharide biosynthesis/export family protein [Elusimicrobiota bacterium]